MKHDGISTLIKHDESSNYNIIQLHHIDTRLLIKLSCCFFVSLNTLYYVNNEWQIFTVSNAINSALLNNWLHQYFNPYI